MKAIKNTIDILEIAKRIETYGEKMYSFFSKKFKNDEIGKIFFQLYENEINHKNKFSQLLNEKADYEVMDNYPGEYGRFLDLETNRFVKKTSINVINEIASEFDAVNLGISYEKETIKLYEEFLSIFSDFELKSEILELIEQEKEHLNLLEKQK